MLGPCRDLLKVLAGIKHQRPRAGVDGGIHNLEIKHTGLHVGHALKYLGNHNRRIQHAYQRRTPLLRYIDGRAVAVHRNVQQQSGQFLVVLYQGNRPGDGRGAGIDSLLQACAPQRFRTHVESLRPLVPGRWLYVFDDEQVQLVFVRQLLNGKSRCAIGLFAGYKCRQRAALHPFNKTKTANPGELRVHVA